MNGRKESGEKDGVGVRFKLILDPQQSERNYYHLSEGVGEFQKQGADAI